jgi:hypothetical protein
MYASAAEESFCARWLSSDAKYSKVKKGGGQTSADDTICDGPINPSPASLDPLSYTRHPVATF